MSQKSNVWISGDRYSDGYCFQISTVQFIQCAKIFIGSHEKVVYQGLTVWQSTFKKMYWTIRPNPEGKKKENQKAENITEGPNK